MSFPDLGAASSLRPDRIRFRYGHEKSIVAAVYNQIAIDCAAITFRHARLDGNGRYLEEIPSGLNYCLSTEANIDQTGRAFIQDVVASMCDEGCVAVVPVDTVLNPRTEGSFDIKTMRAGKVVQWYPQDVRVKLYNDRTGQKEELVLPKTVVAIIENPLYSVMNEPNSTLQRLIRKLNLLDVIDEQSGSGKLNMIVQLPYQVRSDMKKAQAESRIYDLEKQLTQSKYGIAYSDGTEHITQLNRSVENNLMNQIEYLTSMLYSQLGMAKTIFDGTADEATMLNYHNKTIEPIVSAVADEMNRKFLSRQSRSRNQKIVFFKDPFKLAPVASIADMSDKFTRNEILSSNEVRQILGMKPSDDPRADMLRNSNMPQENGEMPVYDGEGNTERTYEDEQETV